MSRVPHRLWRLGFQQFRSNRGVSFLARNNKIYCKSYLICEQFCLGIVVCEKHIRRRKDNSIRREASEDGRQLEMTTLGIGSTVEALIYKMPYLHYFQAPHCQHKSCSKCILSVLFSVMQREMIGEPVEKYCHQMLRPTGPCDSPVHEGGNNTVAIQDADVPQHMTGIRNIAPQLPFQQEPQQARGSRRLYHVVVTNIPIQLCKNVFITKQGNAINTNSAQYVSFSLYHSRICRYLGAQFVLDPLHRSIYTNLLLHNRIAIPSINCKMVEGMSCLH